MNIADVRERSKRLLATVRREGLGALAAKVPRDVLVVLSLLLVAATSFGLGMLFSQQEGQGSVLVETMPLATSTLGAAGAAGAPASAAPLPAGGQVVASKNGSKYYLPWCGGAKRLSEATKVWFASAADAEAHGYAPAKNCPGL